MKLKIGVAVVIALSLGIGTLALSLTYSKEVAYVRVPELIDSFTLKKELSSKLQQSIDARAMVTDSIAGVIAVMETELSQKEVSQEEVSEYRRLVEQYQLKKKQFEQLNMEQAEQYDAQIFNQINQYIEEYGNLHHYIYILGANGDGTMLYAKSNNDLTQEMIVYANERYTGTE